MKCAMCGRDVPSLRICYCFELNEFRCVDCLKREERNKMSLFDAIRKCNSANTYRIYVEELGYVWILEDLDDYVEDLADVNVYRDPDGRYLKYIEFEDGCKIGHNVYFGKEED